MEKFYGFGREHVENYHRKTGRSLFLHLRRIKRAIQKTEENTTEESGVANPPAEKVIIDNFQIIPFAILYINRRIPHILIQMMYERIFYL